MILRGTCDTSIYFCQFPFQLARYVLPLVIGPFIFIYLFIFFNEGIFSGFQNIIGSVSVCLHLTLQTLLFLI